MSLCKIIVLTGPSGVGKSALAARLLEDFPLKQCVTCTTRLPRAGEKDGVDYFFLSEEDFSQRVDGGEMLEHSQHYQHFYGIRSVDIEASIRRSHTLLLLNWEGAKVIQGLYPSARVMFVKPPSLEVLADRLNKRGDQAGRIAYAEEDMKHAKQFSDCLVNDQFDVAYESLRSWVAKIIGE